VIRDYLHLRDQDGNTLTLRAVTGPGDAVVAVEMTGPLNLTPAQLAELYSWTQERVHETIPRGIPRTTA
jgi:hypothetical protein